MKAPTEILDNASQAHGWVGFLIVEGASAVVRYRDSEETRLEMQSFRFKTVSEIRYVSAIVCWGRTKLGKKNTSEHD